MKHLPLILLGAGVLGVGTIFVLHKKGMTLPALPKGTSILHPVVQAKVATQIASSSDPAFLKQLAMGLQKTGATQEAGQALAKAAQITGVPQSVPGVGSLPPITISPGEGSSTSAPSTYKVASGDIPGAIASRFSVQLSALAKANGANSSRIMGGKLNVGEVLKLPMGVVDKGPQSRAKGIPA